MSWSRNGKIAAIGIGTCLVVGFFVGSGLLALVAGGVAAYFAWKKLPAA